MEYNLSVEGILQSNGKAFVDGKKVFTVSGHKIAKDGYSDGLRIRKLVADNVDKHFRSGIMVPNLANTLDALSINEKWRLKQYFEQRKPTVSSSPKIWTEGYQTGVSRYLKQQETPEGEIDLEADDLLDDDEYEILPVGGDEVYYNICGAKKETAIFAKAQIRAGNVGWKVQSCKEDCREEIHYHAVFAKYNDRFVSGDLEIYLAPPVRLCSSIELPNLHITDQAVYRMVASKVEHQPQRSTDASSSTTGNETTETEEEGLEDETTFPDSRAALIAIRASKDLDYARRVLRHATNLPWQSIRSLASSKTNVGNLKKELNGKFMSIVSPAITEGTHDLSDILARVESAANKWSLIDRKNQAALGWMLNRLINLNIFQLSGVGTIAYAAE